MLLSLPDLIAKLQQNEPEEAARSAHALLASATLLGARPLASLLRQAETRARQDLGDSHDWQALARAITDEGQRVLHHLRSRIEHT